MFKQILFMLLLGSFALVSCNNGGNSDATEESSDDMAQFADDEEFKEAHPEPEAIEPPANGEMMTFETPDGKTGSAFAIMPENPNGDFLFVIHEWWGLNDHIKWEAGRLFEGLEGVTVMALDMYDGKVATTQDQAGEFMQAVKEDRAQAIIQGALNYAGPEAGIGTIGWCFGGGWSLRTSIMAGDQGKACVMYYGMPVQEADKLAPIEADILGIFAKQDGWITPEVVNKFESLAKATGESIEIHQYDAAHAFANPSNAEAYNEEATAEANALALNFLQERL
ncbi:dienelactone hydrolase family protein [Flavilitoribacter nigricans]|uniref:Dienelactone hydrolase n=1 Tax=Flavilitoribacter nigricans (strain ATCC 23147 / DSM 23189 / NBRC 102662 / NCIMB 1420 / SS-2) TaxID=1122177 RepID=A0A2D0N6K6_FLAN2|nr:dienelactone hydrolase family protein [Flavilitoribacter nigricans]PHN04020.1 dienelactone hydrolase [Flavilitoribacter nigricans DSM 23189 = NBRC 102662]